MSRPEAIEAIVLATSTNETKARGKVRKVTFEIPVEGPNPFEGLGGERIHIVVVRLNNDETPAEAPKEPAARRSFTQLKPSQQAGIRCEEPEFWQFLQTKAPLGLVVMDEKDAAEGVRSICGVGSRRDLDVSPHKAERWQALEAEYWAWQRGAR